ncbi:thiamine phosphate synthase, partial [Burkholderia sp. Ap-962]|nr:thiamine phosphate synthase [Burkholderia sp. Ap-962]
MSRGASTPAHFAELFWPPADELAAAAERIRARLGDWPA